ncbi:hypothetical protein S100390_v1c05220 [Spiroplasma sp. NBRC 100390]|uniref:hypothetical protein n=2 Tax=Spiroplasma TaxID=2132 RepID=UPI0008928D94|nr:MULTISPECIES: hypothetical protein [unclassified Spiroplasma]AOX43861.1 hypothetical protein STU14_v1c05220 [Spiroplasma sp. TU-14]APE13331.1 hypothetical protein S100390_v1c05220 [Spiroplasma sp. NBRC 100390]
MTMHIILIFSLILMLALYTFHILFFLHYQRQKENIHFTSEYRWKQMLIFIFVTIYFILTPINVFIIVGYILLMTLTNIPNILVYLYVIIAICNYVLILSYLIIQTLVNNSLWIKVNDHTIFFLDEEIALTQIIGIDINGFFNKVLYTLDGETEKKVIIGKKTFQFLEQINVTN